MIPQNNVDYLSIHADGLTIRIELPAGTDIKISDSTGDGRIQTKMNDDDGTFSITFVPQAPPPAPLHPKTLHITASQVIDRIEPGATNYTVKIGDFPE